MQNYLVGNQPLQFRILIPREVGDNNIMPSKYLFCKGAFYYCDHFIAELLKNR
jgi:hypothetical protein